MYNPWSSDWTRVVLPLTVLVLLEEKPAHGYLLLERLTEATGVPVTGGTLYPLLARFGDRGWVEFAWEHEVTGPGRKVFRVTGAGREHADALLDEWQLVRKTLDVVASRRRRGNS
ncbi:PadR family transcriptional regulator [Frondihabitans sp. Leaf304]|uniref:PadR family transcriptional regulator n=1 Tax=Frondihabitans sp. Leaf304 TaxID=1736329 RepID=UPI000A039053|nr:PadR family transcriptional regulator [Frondihabitans sp. Leaf304]